MKYKFLALFLVLPLILSGCIFGGNKNTNNNQNQESQTQKYNSATLNGFSFSVRYPADWTMSESNTGKYENFNDSLVFSGNGQQIYVGVVNQSDREMVLNSYNVETETQTEVNGVVSVKIFGTTMQGNDDRFEAVLIPSGEYLTVVRTNQPGSSEYNEFLDTFNINNSSAGAEGDIVVRLYFDNTQTDDNSCTADGYKEVTIERPDSDLGLIPNVTKLLIQTGTDEAGLEADNLSSSIPVNSRLLSFGYEDNKAIVNFNSELNQGGGSCLMIMRRSQIEQTLKYLNEVSDLDITEVEIQVDGEAETALQP